MTSLIHRVQDLETITAVVGATATGKSDLALDLAQRYEGEIVNADAMQLYRGMDIGTAKTPVSERRGITHHQLDVLDVSREASVATYQSCAREDIQAIRDQGKRVVVVGGSGLYLRALLDDIKFPGTDDEVRARYQAQADSLGPGMLHDELTRRDPEAAARIDRANTRRIVRALEVIEITGKPFSASLPTPRYIRPTVQIGIHTDRIGLDERINERTRAIFNAGLIAETEYLLSLGLAQGCTASRAVGYQQAIEVIQGRLNEKDAVEEVALATRQLSRRQMTWFRKDQRITWIQPKELLS